MDSSSRKTELFPRVSLKEGIYFILRPLVPGYVGRAVHEGLQGRCQMQMMRDSVLREPWSKTHVTIGAGIEVLTLGSFVYASTLFSQEPALAGMIASCAGIIRTLAYHEYRFLSEYAGEKLEELRQKRTVVQPRA